MLDCFSGYHQIFMNKADEEKANFTTPFGTYCYVRMPEGLRTAGCTFNRMIKKVLGDQLGRNISAYVDDVVVRSKRKEDHIQDLREPSPSRFEAEPGEMRLRSPKRQIIGMHDNRKGN